MSLLTESSPREMPGPERERKEEQVGQGLQLDEGESLITDTVSQGSYRRTSLPVHGPFRSVTACSPSPSPSATAHTEADPLANVDSADRGGRRRLLRSGTSGSLSIPTPNGLSRSPSPSYYASPSPMASPREEEDTQFVSPAVSALGPKSRDADADHQRSSSGSGSVKSGKGHRRVSSTSAGLANFISRVIGKRAPEEAIESEDTPRMAEASLVDTEDHIVVTNTDRSAEHASGINQRSYHDRATSMNSNMRARLRPDSTLSAIRTHGLTPSTASTELEEYFSAHPTSPSDQGSVHGTAKTEPKLRRSWSRQSMTSSVTADGELDDETSHVDSDCSGHMEHSARSRRIDFLTRLPPELALYIIFQLDGRQDVLKAAQVSKSWRTLAMDQAVWRNLFFSHPGWAIREDAPLVLQKQAELKKRRAKAASIRAKHRQEQADDQARFERSTATHAYADRLTALKSWRETLHIPSFPDIANLSLGPRQASTVSSDGDRTLQPSFRRAEVDVDGERNVVPTAGGSSSIAPPMSPLRSPTAASGRFGLFLSPGRGPPSTPAGKRRAQEAAVIQDLSTVGGSRVSAVSPAGSIYDGTLPSTSRNSIDDSIAEAEEDFAVSLDWTQLYIDRYILEQRWLNPVSTAVMGSRPARLVEELPRPSKSEITPSRRFLCGHTDSVYCVRQDDGAGTGTGGRLVSGSRDRSIRVWDSDTGECRHVLQGHSASVLSLKYDATLLVSGSSDSEVYVWDFAAVLASNAVESDTEGQQPGPIVHDKRRLIAKLRGHTSAVLDVTFDDSWIVTSSKDATVRVWKRSDLSFFCHFSHGGPVNAIDLQDGKIVSASGDGSMFLWDIQTGAPIHTFQGHTKGLACILYRGETVVSGSNDKTIRVWSTVDGKCTHVLQGHDQLVRTVSFDPIRGLVVSGGYDKVIKIWNTRSCDEVEQEPDSPSHATTESPPEHDFSATESDREATNGNGVHTCKDKLVKLISHPVRQLRCHSARIFDVDFNTTRIISASEDHRICINSFGGQGIDTCLFA